MVSSWSFGAKRYPSHGRLGDPVVLHIEDAAGQSESSMGDNVLKFAHATPSKYPIIGDVIIKMDLQNSAQGNC